MKNLLIIVLGIVLVGTLYLNHARGNKITDQGVFTEFLATNLANDSGSTITQGLVVVADPNSNYSIKLSSAASQTNVLGVAIEEIQNGYWGNIAFCGRFNIIVAGTVNRGDFLETSETPGVAQSQGQTASKGAFAIALEGNSGGVGTSVNAFFLVAEVY